ncbi:MAG: hypothetical protein M0008_01575, partial [Actinomycetota bacterium]|nr:hypothetical protein [Actinomycetota bacterium]
LAAWLSSYHEHQVYTTAASVSSSPLHRHVLGGRGLRVHRIFTAEHLNDRVPWPILARPSKNRESRGD